MEKTGEDSFSTIDFATERIKPIWIGIGILFIVDLYYIATFFCHQIEAVLMFVITIVLTALNLYLTFFHKKKLSLSQVLSYKGSLKDLLEEFRLDYEK